MRTSHTLMSTARMNAMQAIVSITYRLWINFLWLFIILETFGFFYAEFYQFVPLWLQSLVFSRKNYVFITFYCIDDMLNARTHSVIFNSKRFRNKRISATFRIKRVSRVRNVEIKNRPLQHLEEFEMKYFRAIEGYAIRRSDLSRRSVTSTKVERELKGVHRCSCYCWTRARGHVAPRVSLSLSLALNLALSDQAHEIFGLSSMDKRYILFQFLRYQVWIFFIKRLINLKKTSHTSISEFCAAAYCMFDFSSKILNFRFSCQMNVEKETILL